MRHLVVRCVAALGVVFGALAIDTSVAHAQAWVGDPGTLDVSFDYNLGISTKIALDEEPANDNAGSTTQQFTLGADYAPIKNLGISVSLPLVMLKYTGDKTLYPHPGGGTYDDGDYHTTLTDLRAGVRYQVLDEPVALAPHLGFTLPVADYETIGNTVAGRHLKGAHLGLSAGTILGDATYLHAMYEFSLFEKYEAGTSGDTEKYSQNRSDFAFTVGHKLLDYKLDIHADFNVRLSHDGVGLDLEDFMMMTPDEIDFHDAILDEDIYLVGGGVGYQITNAIGVSLSARMFVAGQNTQKANVFAAGLTWSAL